MSFRYSLSAWLGPILIDMSIGDNEIVYIQRLSGLAVLPFNDLPE